MTADGSLFGIDLVTRLDAAVRSVNAQHPDAAFCMVTGDLAHWGEPAAYARICESLDRLSMPWHPLMGNHDDRGAFLAGLPAAKSDAAGYAQFTLDAEAGLFVALDTTEPGTHGGVLDAVRLGWLDARLAEAGRRDVFLFLHHAPMATGLAGLDAIMLGDADALARVLLKHRPPRHIFFGHMHRACHGSWCGIPFSTVKATAHQIHPDFTPGAGLTASSEMPAYAVVLIGADLVVVHDVSYLEEDAAFTYDRDRGKRAS